MNNNIEIINENNTNLKKYKNKIKICLTLIVIITIIMLAVVIKVIINNPKIYFENVINKIYEKSKIITLNNDSYLTKAINYNGTLSINSNIEEIAKFNDYKFVYNIGMDYPNKKIKLEAGLEDTQNKIIDISTFINETQIFLKSSTIFSDILKYESEDIKILFEQINKISNEELDYILRITKESIIKSLTKKDFITSNDKIKINDKEILVKKFNYHIDSKKQSEIMNKLYKIYINDEKVLRILSKILSVSEDELKKYLNEEFPVDENLKIDINLYVKNNNIIKYEIINNGEYVKIISDVTMEKNKYIFNYNQTYDSYKSSNKIIIEKKNNNYEIYYYYDDQKIADIIISNTNKQLDISINAPSIKLIGNYTFIKTETEKNKINIKCNLKLKYEGEEKEENIEVNIDQVEQPIEKIETFDTSNAIDISTSSDEYNNILNNIKERLKGTPFESLITEPYKSTDLKYYEYDDIEENYDDYFDIDYNDYSLEQPDIDYTY